MIHSTRLCVAAAILTALAAPLVHADAPLVSEKSIPLPGIHGGFNHHAVDGLHHRVFVCATTHQSIEVVDIEKGQIVRSLALDAKPAATCYAPNLNLLCVSRSGAVVLYDATRFTRVGSVPIPGSVDELRYDGAAKQLFAGCMTPPNEGIAVIDLTSKRLIRVMKASHPQGLCLEEDGDRVFVSSPRADGITVLSRQSGAPVAEWQLSRAGANYPVGFDPVSRRLFVGCRRPARLVVLDTEKSTEVADVEIGRDTDDLSYDAANQRIYVACGDGTISVVQKDSADRYRTIASVPSGAGGRNCVFVPETAQFCVTVPEDGTTPAKLLVYKANRD